MSQIDDILTNAEKALRTAVRPDTRVRLRNAQIQAVSMRYDRHDVTLCVETIKELRTGIAEHLYSGALLVQAMDTLELAYCVAGFWDLGMYFKGLEFRRMPKKRYYEPREHVLKQIADAIVDLMINDKYDTLVLNTPPRIGKSTLGIMSCGWVAGRDPKTQNILTGHTATLTDSFYRELNDTMLGEEYNYELVFRDIKRIAQSAEATTIDYDYKDSKRDEIARYPMLLCRAVGSGINGLAEVGHGGVLYCDDLVKGYEEAVSIEQMDKLYSRFDADFRGRKKPGAKEFHIGTRWSIHDPLGRVIEANKDSSRFKMISIPALDPYTDESNFWFPELDEFSTEFYRNRRDELMADEQNGKVTWLCLYQQEPIERGSISFPEHELRFVESLDFMEKRQPDEIIAYCDVAFGGADYLSMPIAAVYSERNVEGDLVHDVYIVDWVFLKADYKVTQPVVYGAIRNWGVDRIRFEANNGGDFYGRDIEDMLKKDGGKMPFVTNKLSAGNMTKLNRIEAHTPMIKSFAFLDKKCYNMMYQQAMRNLTTFSRDGNNKNDDAADSCAGLAAMLRVSNVNKFKVLSRRGI